MLVQVTCVVMHGSAFLHQISLPITFVTASDRHRTEQGGSGFRSSASGKSALLRGGAPGQVDKKAMPSKVAAVESLHARVWAVPRRSTNARTSQKWQGPAKRPVGAALALIFPSRPVSHEATP
jgi:hypothetical protein